MEDSALQHVLRGFAIPNGSSLRLLLNGIILGSNMMNIIPKSSLFYTPCASFLFLILCSDNDFWRIENLHFDTHFVGEKGRSKFFQTFFARNTYFF